MRQELQELKQEKQQLQQKCEQQEQALQEMGLHLSQSVHHWKTEAEEDLCVYAT